ncbi:ubiquinone anaerobic biosynthesis accessory factor UbiT [Pseudoxanthomonas koreensis]|uniref:ubiquinone anaerobic biosynthesis accessory factor UbiT n=1 Tax=Pseudoxanthomonas koreensis TaxID=266061 RepID=UPI001391856F|nr:SCP2 sterol-binding domain-containing protein [Pseudoxanthomonas koreensis]KAF1693123.1 hypothetical protein CSC64_06200 [Pseudoxanthomonas koreensis]
MYRPPRPPRPIRGPARRIASGTLAGARHAIDHVDDAVVVLAGVRRHLVGAVRHGKHLAGLPVRDGDREAHVLSRARSVAARVAVPGDTADALMRTLISDACRQQAQSGATGPRFPAPMITPPASVRLSLSPAAAGNRLLRLLPPPRRWKPLLSRLPRASHEPLAERALGRALASLDADTLAIVHDRRLGISVDDLGLEWVFTWNGERLRACREPAEATVRGSATDLALLASRLEDADTLFFQRRLVLTGDTELGLTVRNLLDRLPWEDLPLGLRVLLHRSSSLLRAAREAHRNG